MDYTYQLQPTTSITTLGQAFCLCADKITQRKNNSRPTITQGFFKITQGIFRKKLKVPEVFCLIFAQLFKERGKFLVFVTQAVL